MKKIILLFLLVGSQMLMGQDNIIQNPGFESGPVSWSINQVDHATGWSNGCREQFIGSGETSPDLYDRNGYHSCFTEQTLLPRDNGSSNKRYVHMFNANTDPTTGESVKGTIIEPLSETSSYRVSCYVSRVKDNVTDDPEPELQLEFVLRNNNDCDKGKVVYTSTNIEPVFNYFPCDTSTNPPSTNWKLKEGFFNLDTGDISKNYNRLEIRIKGGSTLLNSIYIDDAELVKVPKVKADFEFTNPGQHTEFTDSYYGPQPVTQICQTFPKTCVTIDGSASTNENGYYISITPFNLDTWSASGAPLFNDWVCTGCTAGPKNLCDLTNLTGTNFLPNVVYKVSLAVGPIWDVEHKFIKINPTPVIATVANQTICKGEDVTFNITTTQWPIAVYGGGSLVGTFYSNPITLSPTSTTSYTFKTIDTEKYACSASQKVSVIVKDCAKACFEIKNVLSSHTEPSTYGPKTVNKLCLPKVVIDGSCSTGEDGYHIRISEFNLSPWTIVTDYYDGWVASGTAPSNINLSNLIGVPSANNGWVSRAFDPSKLYSVRLSVGPDWDAAPLQFFRVENCENIGACFKIKNVFSTHKEPSTYGPKTVNELCSPKVRIDGSCSTGEDGYHIRISEFKFLPWTIVTDYYDGWVASGTAPSDINLASLIGIPSANNGWTSRTFDSTKLYSVRLSIGPDWHSAPLQFFRIVDCTKNPNKVSENAETSSVTIYPNPTKDYVNFSFSENETGNIAMYSFDGTLIHTDDFNKTNTLTVDMSSYRKGFYITKITIGNKTKTYKIVKE